MLLYIHILLPYCQLQCSDMSQRLWPLKDSLEKSLSWVFLQLLQLTPVFLTGINKPACVDRWRKQRKGAFSCEIFNFPKPNFWILSNCSVWMLHFEFWVLWILSWKNIHCCMLVRPDISNRLAKDLQPIFGSYTNQIALYLKDQSEVLHR